MEELILGYDLCNDYCRISCYEPGQLEPVDLAFSEEEHAYVVQTAVCKKREKDEWLLGEEAYKLVLTGEGILVDKLIRLAGKEGTATIENRCYSARELLCIFLKLTLRQAFEKYGTRRIRMLVITVQTMNLQLLDTLVSCTDALRIPRERVHIISHTESYMYYVTSQRKELWAHKAVMFDLNSEGLQYYELGMTRGVSPNVARVEREALEEGFSLDILEHPSGRKLADSIMLSCGERMMQKKLISSVYLTGRGMEHCQEWAGEFLKMACQKRRVFLCENLFAKGAVYAACDYVREKTAYPYVGLCEGRIQSTVTMDVMHQGKKKKLVLAAEGGNWYETKSVVDVILDDMNALFLTVTKHGERSGRVVEIPLQNFPSRPNRTTRISVMLTFTSERDVTVRVVDRGFGEFFPTEDAMIKQEIHLA